MGLAARKLDDVDVLRCPKCGREIKSLCCNHCGNRLPKEQAAILGAVARQIWKQAFGPPSNGRQPSDSTYQGDNGHWPSTIRISADLEDDGSDDNPPISHERYTPPALVDLIHKALGRIDLDPASSKEANKVVKAKSFFTKRDNGLKQRWRGCIFLNPPFDDWPTWVAKLDEEIQSHRVKQAIVVGPANISAFLPLLKRKGLLLIPNERPKYYDPNSDELIAPPFGSLLCHVGRGHGRFVSVFRKHGVLLRVV